MPNVDKHNFILIADESFPINIDSMVIINRNDKKRLLKINLNIRIGLVLFSQIKNTSYRVIKELHTLARFFKFINIHKRRTTMKVFIFYSLRVHLLLIAVDTL